MAHSENNPVANQLRKKQDDECTWERDLKRKRNGVLGTGFEGLF